MKAFRAACCDYFSCTPEEYEQEVFRECLYPHARALALVLQRPFPGWFTRDFELIRTVAGAPDVRTIEAEISEFASQHRNDGLLRYRARVRISGKRLLSLAARVFRQEGRSSVSGDPAMQRGGKLTAVSVE